MLGAGTLSSALPLAMSLGAMAAYRIRERHRRACLNRAVHELRRPLQALALSSGELEGLAPSLGALEDLDRAINGVPPAWRWERWRARALVETALRRCLASYPTASTAAPAVTASRRTGPAPRPSLRWSAGQAVVAGDGSQLVRAIENLIANALEHGRDPVEVVGLVRGERLRILVRDGGGRGERDGGGSARPRAHAAAVRGRRDPRRGHGLRIARDIAASHGGRLVLRRSPAVTIAALDLPLAPHG